MMVSGTLADIQALGYTENEAKAYLALLSHPDVSGYEISRHSGVPRAKVYEVLDGLVAKGAAMEAVIDGRRIFRPLSHRALLDRHRTETASRFSRLQASLAPTSPPPGSAAFFTLTGLDAVLARCRDEIDSALAHVFVAMWDDCAEGIAPALASAAGRGVRVHAVSWGSGDPPRIAGARVHRATPPGPRAARPTPARRWLVAARDGGAVVMAEVLDGRASALCAENHVAAVLAAQWVANEIFVASISAHLGAPSVLRLFTPDEIRLIERMWTDALGLFEVASGEDTGGRRSNA